ncbi:hypothetical protein L6255_02945 [Candidatus Parcubacteria bacterium]|nr:hypothetical protein [Patescibacteria group bacterium]MCG2689370.1 hypothetical protein [Candidatus Parcubacteria bacterium]
MMNKLPSMDELLTKVDSLKKEHQLDLSSDEDLSIAVMNLVSLEEHFFFTASKTEKAEYFDLLYEIREMRKALMKKLVKESEGEIWCIEKHLLAASMRLIEVGTKYFHQEKRKEAEELFLKAYRLYSLFWGINLKLVNLGAVKAIDDDQLNAHDQEKKGFWGKLGIIVKKIIDCCKE